MTPPATQCLPSVSVAVAGMAGCLIPLSSAASNLVGLCPLSVDCCISSPLRLIATSLLCRDPSQCLSTPSPSSVVVTPPGHRYCVIHGWHFENRLLQFSTRPILPLVDYCVSPLGTLSDIHLPTNRVTNAVAAGMKTNIICVGLVLVPPPPISSILTSSVAGRRRRSLPSLFNCWVIVPVEVIAQHCWHQYNAGSSRSLAGGPLQMPDNVSASLVSSGTSSS